MSIKKKKNYIYTSKVPGILKKNLHVNACFHGSVGQMGWGKGMEICSFLSIEIKVTRAGRELDERLRYVVAAILRTPRNSR